MKMGLAEKKTAIADAETELEDLVEVLTNSHKETFQNMAASVDTGAQKLNSGANCYTSRHQ